MAAWRPGPDGSPIGVLDRSALNGGNKLEDWVQQYNEGVPSIDDGVGRLLRALAETGQAERTLVIFTSDQGFAFGQHGFRHKMAPYDDNLRSPLIMSWPGRIPEGEICTVPVGGHDFAPTFFSLAGIELPWAMHGHDLTPLLRDPRSAWPYPLVLAMTGDHYGSDTNSIPAGGENLYSDGIPWWLSLTEGRYKYVRTLVDGEREELYDRSADPDELRNLAAEPAERARVMAMREALLAELRRTGAGMADGLPPVAALPVAAKPVR
jgi:arylsulfatase A-like enzyme